MVRNVRPQPGQLALFEQAALPVAPDVEPESPGPIAPPARLGRDRATGGRPTHAPRTGIQPIGAVDRGQPSSPSATLDEAIPRYLTALAALGRSEHTLKSFELDLRLLRGRLGNRAVGSIDVGHLRQFVAWVRLSRDNAPNSLRRKVATLKNFFGYLRDEGYLRSSPADLLPYPEAFVALPEFLEEDAAHRLVDATDGNSFWRALLLVMLDAGLKRDEVLALRVADVYVDKEDAKSSYLVVRETDAAKRLRSRKLALSQRLRDALRDHIAMSRAFNGEQRIFDVSVRGINFIVETCGSRAGIVTSKRRLTPQALRETFAVAQMRARVRDERLRQAEGWKAEQIQLLGLQHDAEVLDLLGLKDDPDTARKYRQLAKM